MKKFLVSAADLHNIGDLVILLQCAHGLRAYLDAEAVFVRQWNGPPEEVARQLARDGIRVVRGKDPLGASWAAMGAVIVVGGGQAVRNNESFFSLSTLVGMTEIARRTRGGSAMLGFGADHLIRSSHRRLWKRIMTSARLLTVRDEASKGAVADITNGAVHPPVTADLVFLPSPFHAALTAAPRGPAAILIAPCVDGGEGRGLDIAALADSAADIATTLDVPRVSLVAHDVRPGKDRPVCEALASAIRARRPDIRIEQVASCLVPTYTEAYASASVVITNRLHGIIFGLLARKPIVVLNDGTAKTSAAAARFHIPSGPAGARLSVALRERVLSELRHGVPAERDAALAMAREDCLTNFRLLKTTLEAARGAGQLRDQRITAQ
jgi:polysaccharide pyruvyl transferase WcaK-like protein